jgi:hypothetical protein
MLLLLQVYPELVEGHSCTASSLLSIEDQSKEMLIIPPDSYRDGGRMFEQNKISDGGGQKAE